MSAAAAAAMLPHSKRRDTGMTSGQGTQFSVRWHWRSSSALLAAIPAAWQQNKLTLAIGKCSCAWATIWEHDCTAFVK